MRKFFTLAQISKNGVSSLLVDNGWGSDLEPIFGDLSHSEKISEIKFPLRLAGID